MNKLSQAARSSLVFVIVIITTAWSLSSFGYFQIVEALDLSVGYNDAPVLFGLYYGLWSLIAILIFQPATTAWSKRYSPGEDRGSLAVMLVTFSIFVLVIFPMLPVMDLLEGSVTAEVVIARPWYFVPKTAEILFQQVLITALILVLWEKNLLLWQISLSTAILFGGFHLALILNGANAFHVFHYTVAATLFGAIVPYLLLRMRNGFVYSFALHWSWYAIDTTIAHFVFAET